MALPCLPARRVGLVFGVANQRSIAWAIAKAWRAQGAEVIVTCQDDRTRGAVEKMMAKQLETEEREEAGESGGATTTMMRALTCDVANDGDVGRAVAAAAAAGGVIDMVAHAVAAAPPAALQGGLLGTSWEDFASAHQVSTYSLVEIARHASPLMAQAGGGSITSLSFLGAQRAFPGYGVMGVAKAALEATSRQLAAELGPDNIRVNCVSPGPVRTVSARGIRGFADMARAYEATAPLPTVSGAEEVADTVAFLASDAARGITGQTIFVDDGFGVMGVPMPKEEGA
eukprot:g5554.t1